MAGGLILPGGPGFTKLTHNFGASPPTSLGTNFTAGANSADSSVVDSGFGRLTHDAHLLVLAFAGTGANTANSRMLADLFVDPLGGTSWQTLIADLVCGFCGGPSSNTPPQNYYAFPLFVKSGSSLGLRARTAHTADITTGRWVLWAYGCPMRPDLWWCGTRVESVGIASPGTSSARDVVPGSSGAWGSWTNLGQTSRKFDALQWGINGSNAAQQALNYFFQIGANNAQLPGTADRYLAAGTNELKGVTEVAPSPFVTVPSGTMLQARGMCGSSSPDTFDIAAYGVY